MKKIIILLFSLFFVTITFSQKRGIKITNQTSKKEKIIKENKRIIIKTIEGKEISGRYKIENNNSIMIDNQSVDLSNITEIKRNSLFLSILTSSFLVYTGTFLGVYGFLGGLLIKPSIFTLIIPGVALIYGGLKSPNLHKNHKTNNNLNFEIITISN